MIGSGGFHSIAETAAWWVRLAGREVLLSTIVFVVVLALWWPLRRRNPAFGCALWTLVFLRLVLPPELAHPLSAGAFLGRYLEVPAVTSMPAIAATVGPSVASGPLDAADVAVLPGASSVLPVALVVLWLQGLGLYLFFYLRRGRLCRRLVREARTLDAGSVTDLGGAWCRRLGIRRQVVIKATASRISPFTVGTWRPVVVLPEVLLDEEVSTESALAHELVHVARWDSLWLRLQHLVQALYFFHPVAWLSGRVLAEERERLCDETVLSYGVLSRRDYATSLVTVLKLEAMELDVPHLWTHKRRWEMRIRTILSPSGTSSRFGRWSTLAAALVLGVFLLPLAGATAVGEPSPEPQAEVTPELGNPLPGGRISSRYGKTKDPWNQKVVQHQGIDVVADEGTPILAAAAGVVEVATTEYEPKPGSGTVVVVDHGGGLKTYYGHLKAFSVEVGQKVARHDVLGEVGNTGRSTGSHLHFEAWRDGEPLDPASLVPAWK